MTALVLGGGGTRGAVEVGVYRAMVERGIAFDFIVGTSAGAVNGAFIAAGYTPDQLEEEWKNLRPKDLFDWNFRLFWRGSREDSFLRRRGFWRWMENRLPVQSFDQFKIPLTVMATDLETGGTVRFSEGDVKLALLASTAVPMVFRPVETGGRWLVDGSLTDDIPMDVAIQQGASTVVCMVTTVPEHLAKRPTGIMDIHSRTYQIVIDQKLKRDIREYQSQAELIVVETHIPFSVGLLDFHHIPELVELGYRSALKIFSLVKEPVLRKNPAGL